MASPMRVLSLCAGIGGIDLACEAASMEIVGQVELDEFCNRVLAHHWPHVQRARDLYEVTGDEFGSIDLVVAGFPCQPASLAGKRRGQNDARWLWPEVARIIRACQPAFVLLENVSGLISLGLDDVLRDLDSAGYESAACVYPASAVGAPHQRERVFIVAHANQHGGRRAQRTDDRYVDSTTGADVSRKGYPQWATVECGRADVADANRQRQSQPSGRICHQWRRAGNQRQTVEYTSGTGCEECDPSRVAGDAGHAAGRPAEAGQRGQVESGMGRSAHGLPGRLAGHPILSHRWPARPGTAQYEWEAPRTVPASDKTPHRAAKLKALGNAVVPQQVYPILAAIAETWRQMQEVA